MWDAIRRVTPSQKPDGSVRNIVVGNRTDNSTANCEAPEAAKSPFQHALSTSVGSGCGGQILPTLTDLISN